MATLTTAGGTVSGSAKEIIVTAGAGVAVLVILYWLAKREIGSAVSTVADAINPVSDTNLAYKAASAVLAIGNKDATLGTQLYDDVQSAKILLNPKNDQNIVNKGVTAVVQGVTGSKDATLGTAVYDSVQWFKSVF